MAFTLHFGAEKIMIINKKNIIKIKILTSFLQVALNKLIWIELHTVLPGVMGDILGEYSMLHFHYYNYSLWLQLPEGYDYQIRGVHHCNKDKCYYKTVL